MSDKKKHEYQFSQFAQLKKAKFAYIMPLNKKHTRFAVYLDYGINEPVKVLWPEFYPNDRGEIINSDLLPLQVKSRLKAFPAFHFVDNTQGELIMKMVKDYNSDIGSFLLTGKAPNKNPL